MSEDRQTELLRIFIRTFCKYGLDGTTTKKLAEDANLSEAGLYVHFKNKADILLRCVEWHFRNVGNDIAAMLKEHEGDIPAFVMGVFSYTKSMLPENRFIFQVLTHPHYSELIKSTRFNYMKDIQNQFAKRQSEANLPVVLLFNSAINNYILTQEEESFMLQAEFLLKLLGY